MAGPFRVLRPKRRRTAPCPATAALSTFLFLVLAASFAVPVTATAPRQSFYHAHHPSLLLQPYQHRQHHHHHHHHHQLPTIHRRDYVDTVCKPPTQQVGDTVPPCVEIETIETLCTPNGTGPLYLSAHQQCMCRGSYFADWPACLSCLSFHGLRTGSDVARYLGILSAASTVFCDAAPTPTAEFAAVFASVEAAAGPSPPPATNDDPAAVAPPPPSPPQLPPGGGGGAAPPPQPSFDPAAGQTAVSLYYTTTIRQGPGPITGPATAATATRLITASRIPTAAPGGPAATPPGAAGNGAKGTQAPGQGSTAEGGSAAQTSATALLAPTSGGAVGSPWASVGVGRWSLVFGMGLASVLLASW